jgi:hypothetical protein
MQFEGYQIRVSDRKDKKYYAIVDGKKVHFGAKGYEQFHDKLGHYKNLDHNDEKRRDNYYKRHNVDYPKGSADWFAKNVLW